MDFEKEYGSLHRNQKLLVKELVKRGVEVKIIDAKAGLIRANYKGHGEIIFDRDSSIMPYADAVLAGNKMMTKRFLKEYGVSVPIGISFNVSEEELIIEAFKVFNSSVVIKPTFGSYGENVYIDLRSEEEILDAINKIRSTRGPETQILMEEYFDAQEYRVFVTKYGEYAVLNRQPAYVIGDGINKIADLIKLENESRKDITRTAMCDLVIDSESERLMRNRNISLDDIPLKGEKVFLRYNSNVATGGVSIDYTDKVHPTVIENCLKVFDAFPGLPYAGVDYLAKNIEAEQRDHEYRIIEVNTNPGANMHMLPGYGESRNISEPIADMIFPETLKESGEKIRKLTKIKPYKKN